MQQQQYFQQWADMCQNMSQPMTRLTELNARTFSNMYEKSGSILNNLSSVKKPEDFMNAQMALAMEANTNLMEYWTEAFDILKGAVTDFTAQYQNSADQMMKAGVNAFKGKTADKMQR